METTTTGKGGYNNVAFVNDDFSSGSGSDSESPSGLHTPGSELSEHHFVPQVEETKAWDRFEQNEHEAQSASEKHTDFIKKAAVALKLLTITVVFLVTLLGTFVSKGALFFIVAQASSERVLPVCKNELAGSGLNLTLDYEVVYDEKTSVAYLWCIFIAFSVPEVFSLLRSLRVCFMRHVTQPTWMQILVVFTTETLYVLGVSLLFFVAFLRMDSVSAVMVTSGLATMPAFLKLFNFRDAVTPKRWVAPLFAGLSGLALIVQITGLILWPLTNTMEHSWALPLGMFLASFGWWESFVTEDSIFPVARFMWRVKTDMFEKRSRYTLYFWISMWKIGVFFGLFLTFAVYLDGISEVNVLFEQFSNSFKSSSYRIAEAGTGKLVNETLTVDLNIQATLLPSKLIVLQVIGGYLCYIFGKFACQVNIQRVAFSLPLTLANPIIVAILIWMCYARIQDPCIYRFQIPPFAFFEAPDIDTLFTSDFGWFWFLWLLSQFWVSFHVWMPKSQRLAKTDQMFGTPYYSGLLLDQSLLFNRRSDNGKARIRLDVATSVSRNTSNATNFEEVNYEELEKKKKKRFSSGGQSDKHPSLERDLVTRIMGCATMWHENTEEICEMLKSIFRMDEDYSARYLARKMLNVVDPDYYEWETHIFFDDAMEPDDNGRDFVINQFVRLLVDQVDIQGKKWYGHRNMKVPPPSKYATPYGGRLVWTLPGKTKIICHLKDKNKIRHKKRWSQCMYMYYFLGHRLADNDRLTEAQKDLRARNTYLLALDGDVDFQPDAIIKLVDLMKRNPGVGASCGRIHPTGSGYMQWYQMFEYAIGHWLQKATEHIMGCVLCSPGCFSLFRGKAVMDANVMRTYTTVATEPRHFVQYDQGEDRWLCTLLLQQGWRVEYSAASDSFTACPEGFKEFYNQRRRWMPSTIANILDLLGDYKRVVRNNDDISVMYIFYQVMMMIGTALGPGSIFLMLVGAVAMAFGLDNWTAFFLNLAPLSLFILVCLLASSDNQIIVAQILSIGYALLMMAVLVGLLIQMGEDGLLAPTTLSFIFVASVFVLAGFLHPQEFWCLPMGLVYFVTIPSMYLFLVIYSVFNLNVVSWGTREVPKKKTQEELEEEAAQAEEEAKKPPKKATGFWSFFQKDQFLEFRMRNMFHHKDGMKDQLDQMSHKLDRLEMALKKEGYQTPTRDKPEKPKTLNMDKPKVRIVEPSRVARDELKNPFWIEDEALGNGPRKALNKKELTFWNELIEKYLKPLEKDAEKEKRISEGLKELRNQMVFSFLMINSLWVLIVFLLQEHKDELYIEWPWGAKGPNITYTTGGQVSFEYDYLQLEPLGLVFLLFFSVVLLVQLIGMLLHRIMTLGHIVATTKVRLTLMSLLGKKTEFDPNKFIEKKGVEMVKEWQRTFVPYANDTSTTMEAAVESTFNALVVGDSDAIRRVSDSAMITGSSSGVRLKIKRSETIKALKRRHTAYSKRKETFRGGRRPQIERTIEEDDEDEEAIEALEERALEERQRQGQGQDQGQGRATVARTNTFKDPDGLEEREI